MHMQLTDTTVLKQRRSLMLLVAVAVIFNMAAAGALAAQGEVPKPIDVIDTWINYDLRFRLARILWDNISGAVWQGKPIDVEKVKFDVLEPSIVAHLVFDRGAFLAGEGLKYACANVSPPFGLMVASLVAEVVHGLGGAVGYEMSADIKGDTNRRFAEVVGNAMKNVDVMGFLGMSMGSMVGSVFGQALIGIPMVGAITGGMAGAVIGGTITNYFIKTAFGRALGTTLQRAWNNAADTLIAFSRWWAERHPEETYWQKLKRRLRGVKSLYTPEPLLPPPPVVEEEPKAAASAGNATAGFDIRYERVGLRPSIQTVWDDAIRD